FMCKEDGGTIDDFLIYMLEENEYLLVVNAANTEKDMTWLKKHNVYTTKELTIIDESDYYALLSIQGPRAEDILQSLTETNLAKIKFFRFEAPVRFSSIAEGAIVSRTGYTGEDGFEIYLHQAYARKLWRLILNAGIEEGLEKAGLGERNTLRLEAGLPCYGKKV